MTSTLAMVLLEEAKRSGKFDFATEMFVKKIQKYRALTQLSSVDTARVINIYERSVGITDKTYPQRV